MNFRFRIFLFALFVTSKLSAQSAKTDIMLVGTDHLTQIYKKEFPNTDVLTLKAQRELLDFNHLLAAYKPDMICVEAAVAFQPQLDSLYNLYLRDKLNVKNLEDGRSELYQIAFPIAKQMKLKKVYCVNAPGGTSQSILDNGNNIDLYKQEGKALRSMVVAKQSELQSGSIGITDYLKFINQPKSINAIYRLRYITPLRVTNGKFKNPDAMIDTAFINPKYIGAELTSTFKNRDYKICSNIIIRQMESGAKKVLVIIGAAHIGSLRNIFRDDEQFELIDPEPFFK